MTDKQREWSQWYTPEWLARRMVVWSGVNDAIGGDDLDMITMLEPSCGQGAILRHVWPGVWRFGMDIDPENVEASRPYANQIDCGDFTNATIQNASFNFAITNPPYEKGLDAAFVLRCTELAKTTIALVRLSFLAGMKRRENVWKHVDLTRMAVLSERPDFGGKHGAKSDYVVIELRRRAAKTNAPRSVCSVEWWTKEENEQ